MNQIETSEDGIPREFIHLAVQLGSDDGQTEGQVAILLKDQAGQWAEDKQMFSPCFLAVGRDLETLELPGEKVSSVGRCHREMITPGHGTTSRFPAAVELTGLCALSNALIGRRTWDSPEVQEERDEILGSRARAEAFYMQWQLKVAEQVPKAFEAMKRAERRIFGEYSFFAWRETHLEAYPPENPDPPPEWDPLTHEKYCT